MSSSFSLFRSALSKNSNNNHARLVAHVNARKSKKKGKEKGRRERDEEKTNNKIFLFQYTYVPLMKKSDIQVTYPY
jgi:hypothetical protein